MSAEQPRARSTETDKLIGEVLANRYQIELRLGEGAMGVVYRARHVKVGRPFAVKVLHPQFLADDKVAQRFEREAELAGRLRHPNVIGVVDVGETAEGYRYMVMDYVEGSDLAALLGEAPMPPQRIIHLVRQLLEGLYHAHEQGLIHRDFKPENVIVERDTHGAEVPRIVDFGIAILREGGESPESPGRLTTNGLVLGTPHYMAPEQAVADPVDHRIDLFALGIVIYEMLCGKLPFDGSGAEVARANLMLDPPRISQRVPYLEVDPLLEAFARRLMAKSRNARPPTAKAARELLDLIDRDRPAAATALCVPIEASTRIPAVTAPVTPPPVEEPVRELRTPPQAPPLEVAVAIAEPGQRAIATDPVDELPYAGGGKLLAAAITALVVLGVAIAVIVAGSSKEKDKAPVAAIEDPRRDEIKPPPAPVDEVKPPVDDVKPPVDEVKPPVEDIKAPEPPPATRDQALVRHPDPRPRRPVRDPRATKAPAHDEAAVTKPADVAVKPPDVTKTVDPKPIDEVKAPKPPVDDETAAKRALYALYGQVGAQLPSLGSSPEAVKIRELYSLIQIQNAMKTPGNRADGRRQLENLHDRIVALKKSQP
jgi:hypothetical protein